MYAVHKLHLDMDQQFIINNDSSLPLLTTDYSNQIICRTCLSEQCNTQSLFEADIDKMLMYCTSIQVRKVIRNKL